MRGIVFNIQKFSLNDGNGIRTIVFFKGCPLKCLWCSNPESQDPHPQRLYWSKRCIKCNRCIHACPERLGYKKSGASDCDRCMACVRACPSQALRQVGEEYSLEELVYIVERDALFYQNSHGGVTLSGGEPLTQWKFCSEFARELHAHYIDVAMETTGYAPWAHLLELAQHCDTILYDIKQMNSTIHKEYTGVSNELILENAARLRKAGASLIIRIPLIHRVNDDLDNIMHTGNFAKKIGVKEIHLLPFHRLGEPKYIGMGLPILMGDATPPPDHISFLTQQLEQLGLRITIGG